MGYCRAPNMDYTEVRVLAQDWESSIFQAWILQIVLSEILDVPVSVESGLPGLNADFYNSIGPNGKSSNRVLRVNF